MKKRTLFVLAMIILGMGMLVRTFFGGNGNEETLHDETPGFIEEISSTGNQANTGNQTNTSIETDITTPQTSTQNNGEIRVMMPAYFYTSGWKNFAQDLYNDENIYMNFIFTDDLNSYRDEISNPNFSRADLILFPYDRHENIKTRTFTSNSIQQNFDPLLAKIWDDSGNFGFRPFAADPMVMYTSISPIPKNFYDISETIYNRNPTIQLAFPIFFGLLSEDKENEGFSREYQDIVWYALMHYFETYKDKKNLQSRLDINLFENSNETKNYNLTSLNNISEIIDTPECKQFPSICFQVRKFVGTRFGFLSDEDVVRKYFPKKLSNFEDLGKTTRPFFSLESPVRIRGRGISDKVSPETLKAIESFMGKYINQHDKYNLWSSTLPVFKSEDGESLSNNHYIGYRWYILDTGGDYINSLRENENFWELLEHKISAEDYLK